MTQAIVTDDIDFDAPLDPNIPARCPHKCEDCGRVMITTDPFVQCEDCHNLGWDNFGHETDQDGDPIDYDGMTYARYLRTDHWQAVRQTMIESAKGKCACCSSTLQLHVHHREYPKRRIEIKSYMLVVLCKRCHEAIHEVTR